MKKIWKISWVFVVIVAVFLGIWFSANSLNVNSLGILSSSHTPTVNVLQQTNTYTWRFFCPIDLSVMAIYGWGSGFSNCQYSLRTNPSNITLSYNGMWSAFSNHSEDLFDYSWYDVIFVQEEASTFITETVVCSNIVVEGINPLEQASDIYFVRKDWTDIQIPRDFEFTTPDVLNLSYDGKDTLTWIQDMKIFFYACPCTLDNEKPIISDWTIWGAQLDINAHYQWQQSVQVLVYDQWWTSRPYWTQWTTNFLNYTGASVPNGMDNQEWVNSGTIKVKIYVWDELKKTMSAGNGLSIKPYTWSDDIPKVTWDGNTRWYLVSFDVDFDSVEVPIKIEVSAADKALHNGGDCERNAIKSTSSITLNQKKPPIITFNSPTWNNVNPNTWVKLTVSDERAWINTGSLVVEILPVMSWGQLIMSWSVYSWSDLSFQLIAGSGVLWWASKYEVTFQPRYEFAVSTWIILSGYVEDLIGMTGQKIHQFNTRQDCTFYGCVNFVDIFSGSMNISNLIQWHFTWSLIVVTGTILPYPYLTWADGDIVMCGPIDRSINLTWNIDIYSGSERINWSVYPYEDLYVTGLNFEYQSGVITPIIY